MKKIIVVLAAVAMAIGAQAAVVSWSVSGVVADPTGAARTSYTAFLFDAAVTDYATLTADLAAGKVTSFTGVLGTKTGSGTGDASFLGAKTSNLAQYTAGDQPSLFAIILNSDSVADASYFMAVAAKQGNSPVTSTGAYTVAFGSQKSAGNTTWTAMAVPEPTSGLLLLLGMAGLALKRKQA